MTHLKQKPNGARSMGAKMIPMDCSNGMENIIASVARHGKEKILIEF